jgi:restriction endonuclease S subunit
MDGLECSEITLCYVMDKLLRLDAEYYQKDNLILESVLKSMAGKTISTHNGKTDCSAFYPSITGYYSDDRSNIPFLRVNEIVDGLVVISDKTVFLPEEVLKANSKTIASAYPGDIIIAKGGNTLAKVGLVTDEFSVYATCRDVIILRTGEMTDLNKFYLWAYLHGSFGQKLMWRSASQTGQPHLTLKSIDGIHVPEYSVALQGTIEQLYSQSVCYKQMAQNEYDSAKAILHSVMVTDQVVDSGVAIKEFSQSFGKTGRFDAEYYQSKYEKYTEALNTQDTVGTLCKLYDQNFIPEAEIEYTYIELASVGRAGEIVNAERKLGSDLPTRARRKVNTGQVIVSSIEGSLQSCALITSEFDESLCSTGFYVMDSPNINSETLLVLFKCEIMQALMKQRCSGSILAGITKDELLSMPLPRIDETVQRKIATKVRKSFEFRCKSNHLLKNAKRAVEIAIEQGEDTALAWLKEKTGEQNG